MAKPQEIAKELLALEELFRAGKLSQKQSTEWQELAARLFNHQGEPHQRKSSRLPVSHACSIQAGKGTFFCTMTEVSLVGLTLSGAVFGYVDKNIPITLKSVEIGKKTVPVSVGCTFVSARRVGETWVAGLALSTTAGTDWQAFFDTVYYPLYLERLRDLAKGMDSSKGDTRAKSNGAAVKETENLAAKSSGRKPAPPPASKKAAKKPEKRPEKGKVALKAPVKKAAGKVSAKKAPAKGGTKKASSKKVSVKPKKPAKKVKKR